MNETTTTEPAQSYYIQGDFHYVEVTSPRKGDLKRAGIRADMIHSERIGYARYGSRSYPRYHYVGTVHVTSERQAVRVAREYGAKGFLAYVRYHCAD